MSNLSKLPCPLVQCYAKEKRKTRKICQKVHSKSNSVDNSEQKVRPLHHLNGRGIAIHLVSIAPPAMAGLYILASQKNCYPPPVEILHYFLGLLLLVSSNSSGFLGPPSNSCLFFNLDKNFPPPQGGGDGQKIYP